MIEQVPGCLVQDRMPPLGIKFDHRGQDESPEVQARVRNHETQVIDNSGPVKQEIEVQCPGAASHVTISAQGLLDLTAHFKKALGSQISVKAHDAIQKPAATRIN